MEFAYTFPRIFKEFSRTPEGLVLNSQIDIAEYPFPLREIFYKYYPQLVKQYPHLLQTFSADNLEAALLLDEQLPCLPMDLIDPDVIATKTFSKPLSFDYDMLNEIVQIRRKDTSLLMKYIPPQFDRIVKYKVTDWFKWVCPEIETELGQEFLNVDLYCHLLNPPNVLNICPAATDHVNIKYITKGFNSVSTMPLSINIFDRDRFFDHRANRFTDELWNAIPEDLRCDFACDWCKKYKLFPMNFFSELQLPDYSPMIEILDIGRVTFPPEAEQLLEKAVQQDTYQGEWRKMQTGSRDYNNAVVDDIHIRLGEKGIKERFEFIDNHSLTSLVGHHIMGNLLTPRVQWTSQVLFDACIEKFPAIVRRFDLRIPEIYSRVLQHAQPVYIIELFTWSLEPEEYSVEKIHKQIRDTGDYIILQSFVPTYPNFIQQFVPTQESDKFTRFVEIYLIKLAELGTSLNHSEELVKYVEQYMRGWWTRFMDKSSEPLFDRFYEHDQQFIYEYLEALIRRKQLTPETCTALVQKYVPGDKHASGNERLADLGKLMIEVYHEEPYFELYGPPNYNHNGTYARAWSQYVNNFTIPREMTEGAFYEYMVRCNGQRRSDKSTSCYTFFSNSLENKIIFVKSDALLSHPAVLRVDIPIPFDKLKSFLHEGIDTNGICMFTEMSDNDWNKVSGGNNQIDCVTFSDKKNVWCERTPLRTVLKHLVDSIELEFEVKIDNPFE